MKYVYYNREFKHELPKKAFRLSKSGEEWLLMIYKSLYPASSDLLGLRKVWILEDIPTNSLFILFYLIPEDRMRLFGPV